MARLNHAETNQKYVSAMKRLREKLPPDGIVVSVSDFSLIPIFASQLYPDRSILAIERSKFAQRGVHNLAKHNHADIEVGCGPIKDDVNNRKVAMLCGEPYFSSSLLPWHDLYFWYLRTELSAHLLPGAVVSPCAAHLYGAAVRFDDLWKIRAPVGVVEGFDVSPMDDMIDEALDKKEYHEAESHALWEYPNTLLTPPVELLTFNFCNPVPDANIEVNGILRFLKDVNNEVCHGVVLWMEYDLDGSNSISTGLIPSASHQDCVFDKPQWCPHHKQGVFLFKKPVTINNDSLLNYQVSFIPQSGDVRMNYSTSSL